MEIRFSKIVAREIKEAVIEVYGLIGDKLNGDYLASEINYLGKTTDVITFRINSFGGNLVQGLSVIGAIVASPSRTISVIEGVAGSMSGVIALSCSMVKMNDFARLMLHAPYFVDDKGNEVKDLSEDDKAALENMKGILTQLLTRRGKSTTEVEAILKKDTWYTAQEALSEGFIDEIIDTGVDQSVISKLSLEKLVAFINTKFLPTNTDMKKIAAKLGCPETEEAIITAIDQKETALADSRKKLVDAVIAAGKKSGAINDANVASMTRLGTTDLDLLVDLVVKPIDKADNTRLSDVIAQVNQTLGEMQEGKKETKTWNDYSREELEEKKASDLVGFKKLYKEYWGQDYTGK